MKRVLFVCYGSGHVRMVIPVAQALRDAGLAEVQVLGLTTAAADVRAAGLPLLQVRDFVQPGDEAAVQLGHELVSEMGGVTDPDESAAYLGLCYAELVASVGPEPARERYRQIGRHAFLPEQLLLRIVSRVKPDLVVATNSPRAEQAAVLAARRLGIPAVCMVDLFALDEVRWIGQPGYADRICVLNEQVRQFLVEAGRLASEIAVTGNPAFDVLIDPAHVASGLALRSAQGWQDSRVLLWPVQVEPAQHPLDGRQGDPQLPDRALQRVADWVLARSDTVLCVRARAGQAQPPLARHDRIVQTGQDWPLPALLHAVDVVVTLTSTVGLEGHLAGTRLVQVLGSVFDASMPLARFGIADAAVPLAGLDGALAQWIEAPRRALGPQTAATPRVIEVLGEFL